MDDDLGLGQQPRGAHRQQIGVARAGPDERDGHDATAMSSDVSRCGRGGARSVPAARSRAWWHPGRDTSRRSRGVVIHRVGGEALEQWSQVGGELVERDVGAHALGEAVAAGRPTEVEVVRLLRAPDDADLGGVRPRAAVRAPRHVEPDRLTLVAGVGEQLLELVDHRRQDALGLAQRLPARRQRRTGDRQPPQRAHLVGQRDLVSAQHREQRVAVVHAAQQEVLAWCDPDLRDES